MSVELKIKAKTLMKEAHIIRQEENTYRKDIRRIDRLPVDNAAALKELEKIYNPTMSRRIYEKLQASRAKFASLRHHRTTVVRHAARKIHIARMFLKGVQYRVVENKVHLRKKLTEMDIIDIVRMILIYGVEKDTRIINQKISEWFDEPLFCVGDVVRTVGPLKSNRKKTISAITPEGNLELTWFDHLNMLHQYIQQIARKPKHK